jgi:hypothetical protein
MKHSLSVRASVKNFKFCVLQLENRNRLACTAKANHLNMNVVANMKNFVQVSKVVSFDFKKIQF